MNRSHLAIVFVFSICIFSNFALAKEIGAKESLKGIKEMMILIDFNHGIGLDPKDVKSDISLKLKQSGIKVVEPDSTNELEIPALIIRHIAIPFGMTKSNYASFLELHVYQKVKVVNNGTMVFGRTYLRNSTGTYKYDNASELNKSIQKRVDEFLNDYLDVNPR